MPVDTVALRGPNRSGDVGIEEVIRGVADTILTDGRFSREPRIDPAEIAALLSERGVLPQNLVQTIDSLREEIGEFIVSNLNTPQTSFGFNTKPADPIEVGPIEELVWQTHDKLDALYRTLQPTDPVALAYRSLIVDVRAQLKSFLLGLSTKKVDQGLNEFERPAFISECIAFENYLGQTVQSVEGVRMQVGKMPNAE